MIKTRNAVVHGDTVADLEGHELQVLYSTLQSLVEELRNKQTA